MYGSSEIFIPCDFFIWTSLDNLCVDVNLRKIKNPIPHEIVFVSRNSIDADFTVNGNNGKVKELKDVTNPKAEHYIKINPLYDKNEVKEFFNNLTYDFHSSVNGGVAWINKDDIAYAFNQEKERQKVVFKKI